MRALAERVSTRTRREQRAAQGATGARRAQSQPPMAEKVVFIGQENRRNRRFDFFCKDKQGKRGLSGF